MRDGVERSERRERKRRRRWEVHGRSLQHVLQAVRRRAQEAGGGVPPEGEGEGRDAGKDRRRRRRRNA